MSDLNLKFARFSSSFKANSEKIINEIGYLDVKPSSGVINAEKHNRIRLTAVKAEDYFYKSAADYINKIDSYMDSAKENNSAMIIFPQLFTLFNLSIPFKGKKIFHELTNPDLPYPREYFEEYMQSLGRWNYDIYLNTFRTFAKKYNMFIQPGSVFVADGGKYYNRSFFFNNKGDIISAQDKLFPTKFEQRLGISAGSSINVAKTVVGNFTVLNDYDCVMFETAKIAGDMEANTIISSHITNDPKEMELFREALLWRCEEQNMYGIHPCYKQDNIDTKVYFSAPSILTDKLSGVLSQSDEVGTKSYSFNYAKLENRFDPYSSDKNPYLYAKYFKEIYK